jgi:hypothetical protein
VNRFFEACERIAFRIPVFFARISVHPIQFLSTLRMPTRDFDPDADRSPLGLPIAMILLLTVAVAAWSLWL